MKKWLVDTLAVTSSLSAFALVLAAIGFLPAGQPEGVEREAFRVGLAKTPSRAAPTSKKPVSGSGSGVRFTLCPAGAGARLYPLTLRAGESAFMVWCRGGYRLFELGFEAGGAVTLTRLSTFSARGELPGGVASGDFDGDGQLDLALGSAPKGPVVHRSRVGAYLLRGRAEGGFEPAMPLVESPTVALATLPRSGAADGLVVLTRGDPVAQRPGQLWVFSQRESLVREHAVQTLLAPRDLVLGAVAEDSWSAWVLSGADSRVARVRLAGGSSEPRVDTLVARGPLGFVRTKSAATELPWLWGTAGVFALEERDDELSFTPILEEGPVGPTLRVDLDGDRVVDLFSAVQEGVAMASGAGAPWRKRALPDDVLDVATVHDGAGLVHPVVLSEAQAGDSLVLGVLPDGPIAPETTLRWTDGEVREATGHAEVALQ